MTPKLHKRKCKICGTKFQRLTPLHYLCSYDCAVANAKILAEKNNRSKMQEMRREIKQKLDKLKTRQEHLKEAQRFFNIFIRTRDAKEPCISCGRHHSGQYHAGHYRSVGACPELRFEESQVWKQCAPCNNHLSGNIVAYRQRLIEKIGIDKVEWIEGSHEPLKLTIEEIKAIKVKYKQKTKELLNQGE